MTTCKPSPFVKITPDQPKVTAVTMSERIGSLLRTWLKQSELLMQRNAWNHVFRAAGDDENYLNEAVELVKSLKLDYREFNPPICCGRMDEGWEGRES